MSSALVIGVGNESRGDDGAGIEVARRVRRRCPPGTVVLESAGDAASLIEAWRGRDEVVLVDASSGIGPPGSVRRFDANVSRLPAGMHTSSHALGVAEAVEMARALGALPGRMTVYAIEGARFRHGSGLSPVVRDAVARAEARVLRELERAG
jgi:hydrogenase maturation protease